TIFDPRTFDAAANSRVAFPGNRIPLDRINPVSRKILDLFMPLPNLLNPTQNFISSPTAPRDVEQYTIKIDQKLPHNDDLFAPFTFGLARMSIAGFTNIGDRGWQNRWDTTADISDALSYTRGNHRLKAGFSIRPFKKNRNLSDVRESMSFSSTYTTDPRNAGST